MSARIARSCLGIALALVCSLPLLRSPARAEPTPAADPSADPSARASETRSTVAKQGSTVPPARPVRPKDRPFLIVAFGSSSTQGVGASAPDLTYPARTQRLFAQAFGTHPGVVVINRGVGGEDIDDMMKRLAADVMARRPDLVLWQAGSNDILRGVPLDRFTAELTAGVSAMRAAGAEVILIEPQWCPAFTHQAQTLRFVNAMRVFAAVKHVALVRRYDLMQQWIEKGVIRPGELVGRDGLHMTDQGYDLLARAVFEQVKSASPGFRDKLATLGSRHM